MKKSNINNNAPFLSFLFQTGHTPLQKATSEGHLDVVKHLISRGAAIDHQDEVVRQKKPILHLLKCFGKTNAISISLLPRYYVCKTLTVYVPKRKRKGT